MATSASTKPRARLGVECTHLAGRIRGSDDAEEKLTALAIYGTQRVLDLAREAQTQYRKIAIEASDWKPEDGIEPLDRRGDQWEASRHDTLQAMTVRRTGRVSNDLDADHYPRRQLRNQESNRIR